MLIAIIDDGICNSLYENLNIRSDLSVARDGTIAKRTQNERILTNHGTTCAAIIAKYAPEAEFCSLRIFQRPKLHASCKQLVSALEWCLKEKIPIVHLSIGTHLLSDYREIQPIIARMLHQNQAIIAAHNNRGVYSIPANLGGVFCVVADSRLRNSEYSICLSSQKQTTIYASSMHNLLMKSGDSITTQIANSYAAPTMTARLHNILQRVAPLSLTAVELLSRLEESSSFSCNHPDFITDAFIINPNNHPILYKHLFFHYLGELEVLSELKPNPRQNDIVYLAPQKPILSEHGVRWLNENAECYGNILYGGVLSSQNTCLPSRKLIWSEQPFISAQKTDVANHKRIEIPIVYINGSEMASLYLACELRQLFFADGYQCLCVSNWQFSYLYSFEYAPDVEQIFNIYKYYEPDIIICCGSVLKYRTAW